MIKIYNPFEFSIKMCFFSWILFGKKAEAWKLGKYGLSTKIQNDTKFLTQ